MTPGAGAGDAGISLVGAGALGQSFALLLARGGVPVSVLARGDDAARLRTGRLHLKGVVDAEVPVPVVAIAGHAAPLGSVGLAEDAAHLPAGSGVLFTTKSHQLGEAIAQMQRAEDGWGRPVAWVGGVQNGMQKDTLLAAAFGAERLVGAATILSAQRDAAGTVVMTGPGPTYLGVFPGGDKERARDAYSLFHAAGLQVEWQADVRPVLWSKACNAAGVFGVCVLARCSGRRLSGTPALTRAFLALVRETADLAARYGVAVGDYPGFPIATHVERNDEDTIAVLGEVVRGLIASGAPENYPSMVQDVLAGRVMEVEGVFGDLVERGNAIGAEIPRLRFVCDVLRGINAAFGD